MITQNAFTSGKSLVETILGKMVGINKWRKVFFIEVILLFLTIKGRINFTQMGRYSTSPEVRFRNMFKKRFNFESFNSILIKNHCSDELLIGFDPSYISKSGKHTDFVGMFYSGVAGMVKRGLEFGCLAIIDVKQNTAYHLDAVQTQPVKKSDDETGLINQYCSIFNQTISTLKKHSKILVVDAWFNKSKFIDAMTKIDLEVICRARNDANLNYLYTGPKKQGPGRPKKHAGKVGLNNIDKSVFTKVYEDADKTIYEAVVYSVSLKRNIKLAYTEYQSAKGVNTILYFSTNTSRSAIDIVRYYRARFQMEFIFRDGKQFTGLDHCQARSESQIYSHVNYAMTAVNIAKAVIRKDTPKDESRSCSIQDIKTELFNQFLLERIFINYRIDPELQKNTELKQKILDFGKVAA